MINFVDLGSSQKLAQISASIPQDRSMDPALVAPLKIALTPIMLIQAPVEKSWLRHCNLVWRMVDIFEKIHAARSPVNDGIYCEVMYPF